MPSADDIKNQQTLLENHRKTLQHYLKQRSLQGESYEAPGVAAGIDVQRAHIARIKAILREWQVEVKDLPDDSAPPDRPPPPQPPASPPPQARPARGRGPLAAVALLLATTAAIAVYVLSQDSPGQLLRGAGLDPYGGRWLFLLALLVPLALVVWLIVRGAAKSQAATSTAPGGQQTKRQRGLNPPPTDSPFIVGPPVPAERFYGHVELRGQLKGWLGGSSPQSCMLVGLHRSGKSSLLRYIRERPDEFFQPNQRPLIVLLNFADATCATPADVLESLRRSLEEQLGRAPWRPAENTDPHTVKAAMERLRDQGRRLVVLIDEFQNITRRPDEFTHWGDDWRSKMQSGCLTCVIASVRPVSEVYRQVGHTSPFGNDLRDATLGAIETADWQALVRAGMNSAKRRLRGGDLELIDELAGGLPFYTQLAGEALLRSTSQQAARAAFAAQARPHFESLWRKLDDAQRHALRQASGGRAPSEQAPIRYLLRTRGLLRRDTEDLFSSAFAAFVQEQP